MDIINEMKKIYRYTDVGHAYPSSQEQNKKRPSYFDKEKIFRNFISEFGTDNLIVIADNVNDTSYYNLCEIISKDKIIRTDFKSGALSFLYAVEYAIDNYKDNSLIYLVEDDYIHREGAKNILIEGLQISDYVTLYDHPDKYIRPNSGGNPYVTYDGGERTIVYLTRSAHWKITNSTTMTFATNMNIIRQDYIIYRKYCENGYPNNFEMFLQLGRTRKLISSIPGYSAHCENNMLAPLFDWSKPL